MATASPPATANPPATAKSIWPPERMWFSFWRSRNRFSLDELRYLTDQLRKVQVVNEVNKDFVIEALRSIAELVIYGDQHDSSFFEFFMEKQIMGEFVRMLKVSRPPKIALQLLQTMSIIIQNIRSENAIYYIFSNEHINYLITYSFDFQNDELLSHYISFLRAISVKLNKSTIPLLVKIQNDVVVSFPLYVEAIRFAFHEENMLRTAVRALTLNVYHAGDESVNNYVSGSLLSDYFSNLVKHFRKQCIELDGLVSQAATNTGSSDLASHILAAVDEIEDTLYYFSDVISAGVPDLGRLLTENILQLLVFPILLPSLKRQITGTEIGISSSLYLLCCILRIVKTKDLASTIAATLFFPAEAFIPKSEARPDENDPEHSDSQDLPSPTVQTDAECSQTYLPPDSSEHDSPCYSSSESTSSLITLRELFLSYIASGDDIQVLGSLSLLSTLLQTKELDESMLDRLGILPQRKHHKKYLLQSLMGEGSGEERLFSFKSGTVKDSIHTEVDRYMQNLKEKYGLLFCCQEQGTNPERQRYQVLDALVSLFSRDNLSTETLWTGGWLFRQLLPHGEEEFTTNYLKQLKDSVEYSTVHLFDEIKGSWCDMVITVVIDEWRNCKRAIEAASPKKEPKSILFPSRFCSGGDSSCTAGERMCEFVKIFVLRYQLLVSSSGASLTDQPPIHSPTSSPGHSRAKIADPNVEAPILDSEINLENALPCRIAFEKGKEHHFCLLAISSGISGWVVLAEELPLKQRYGVVHVTAPLAGSDPKIDGKHPKWLHLCVRPSNLPSRGSSMNFAFAKAKPDDVFENGRWTLAFSDEEACKLAESMILKEMHVQQSEVEKRLKPLLGLDISGYTPYHIFKPLLVSQIE